MKTYDMRIYNGKKPAEKFFLYADTDNDRYLSTELITWFNHDRLSIHGYCAGVKRGDIILSEQQSGHIGKYRLVYIRYYDVTRFFGRVIPVSYIDKDGIPVPTTLTNLLIKKYGKLENAPNNILEIMDWEKYHLKGKLKIKHGLLDFLKNIFEKKEVKK